MDETQFDDNDSVIACIFNDQEVEDLLDDAFIDSLPTILEAARRTSVFVSAPAGPLVPAAKKRSRSPSPIIIRKQPPRMKKKI